MTSSILARISLDLVDKGTMAKRFIDKKVLIVIDDVDEKTRIEDLIGKRGKQDWFASGSRIILTTRNKGFLRQVQVDESYELSGMEQVHSLQLFSIHAFDSDNPEIGYVILSKQIVKTTGGLPLALEVIGSSLRNKSKEEWENRLKKLRDVPAEDVSKKLRISYDELDERQKHLFLDIACFFIGLDQRIVIHFWDPRKFYPEEAIGVLQQKSLIKIHDNLLWMHDQLRDLGREIVRGGNIMEPEMQTRLWNREEATEIFMTKRGTEKIQGICIEVNDKSCPYFIEEELAKLPKVRLFWVESNDYFTHPWSLSATPSNFLPRKPIIFSELRWLSWHYFPHMYIETRNFSLLNLTILNLSYSEFTIDWDGWTQIKIAKNLKVLNLTKCTNLVKTPELSSNLLLEQLILQGCTNLVEIDKSIGMLEHLVLLDLRMCYSLCQLPTELSCMKSLTELLLNHTKIVEIPQWRSMIKLEIFSAYYCRSLKNCISLSNLTSLKKLSLTGTRVTLIPDSIGELVRLPELSLWGCESIKKLPESIGGLVSLVELDISYSGITELPDSIGCLTNLKILRMKDTSIRELPYTIGMIGKLEEIDAYNCEFLHGLPMLPESLINLILPYKTMVTIPDLSNLIILKQLRVEGSMEDWEVKQSGEWAPVEMPSPWWIGRLSKAEKLNLAFPSITTLHPNLGALSLLTDLSLKNCYRLQSIPKLPSNLTNLKVIKCRSLETISDPSHLKKLSTLEIIKTPLIELEGLQSLESLLELTVDGCMFSEIDGMSENLRYLGISECMKLERLPQMSNYKKLENFTIAACPNLVEIHGRLESIKSLSISHCMSLVKIPYILDVKTMDGLWIDFCPKLCNEEIYQRGPILTNNSSMSVSEQSFMRTMFKICGFSQDISWRYFPRFETSNFSLLNLTILNLSYGEFTIDWDGWSQVKMAKNLKVLNLTWCTNLVKTPEFSSHPLLEQLILKGCTKLVEIDESIGMLEHLVLLDLRACYSLCRLPMELNCMESLTELLIDHTKIVEIPQWPRMVKLEFFSAYSCKSLKNCISLNNLSALKKFSLAGTGVTLIPNSIGELVRLSELSLWGCESLKKLPESIGGLVSLVELDISYSGIKELPDSIGCLTNLKILRMKDTSIRELPYTIGKIGKLEEIDAYNCEFLHGLPMLPESLINLILPYKTMVTIPDLSNLIILKQLRVEGSMEDWEVQQSGEWAPIEIPSPWWIGRLSKVEKLNLVFPSITTLHPNLGALSLLTELSLKNCYQLQSVPKLPSNLTNLKVIKCRSLETISDLSHLRKLSTLEIIKTPLIQLEGLHSLDSLQELTLDGCMFSEIDGMSENLRYLGISECMRLERLPHMSNYKMLENFTLEGCPSLVEIHGRLESIKSLSISHCMSLVKIPDFLDVKTMVGLWINFCPKLCNEEIYQRGPILRKNFSLSGIEWSFYGNCV